MERLLSRSALSSSISRGPLSRSGELLDIRHQIPKGRVRGWRFTGSSTLETWTCKLNVILYLIRCDCMQDLVDYEMPSRVTYIRAFW